MEEVIKRTKHGPRLVVSGGCNSKFFTELTFDLTIRPCSHSFFLGFLFYRWDTTLHILVILPAMLIFFCLVFHIFVWFKPKFSSSCSQRCPGSLQSHCLSRALKTRTAALMGFWCLPSSTSLLQSSIVLRTAELSVGAHDAALEGHFNWVLKTVFEELVILFYV